MNSHTSGNPAYRAGGASSGSDAGTPPQRRTAKTCFLVGCVSVGVTLVILVVPVVMFRGKLAHFFFNVSDFSSAELEAGRRRAREGQVVVVAIREFKSRHGHWPSDLSDVAPHLEKPVETLRGWHYWLDRSKEFRLNGVLGPHMLYYESERGWLMSMDADTCPVSLGTHP